MPTKQTSPSADAARAKRIADTAREVEASESKREFERAFKTIVKSENRPRSNAQPKSEKS